MLAANINLLPWRKQRRQEQQAQLAVIIISGLIVSGIALYFTTKFVSDSLYIQAKRNQFLQRENDSLDERRTEILALEGKKRDLIARMKIVQDLQTSRAKLIKIFDALPKIVPDGIYLDNMKREGGTLTLSGIASSSTIISVFMRNLDKNPEFEKAKLKFVKQNDKDGQSQKFTLVVNESSAE